MLNLFETETFFSKSCELFLNEHFLQNKFSNKLSVGLCRLGLSRLWKYRAVDLSSRPLEQMLTVAFEFLVLHKNLTNTYNDYSCS